MHIVTKRMLLFLTLAVGLSACVSSKKYKNLEEEKMNLEQSLNETRSELKDVKEEKMALEADKASLDKKVTMLEKDMANAKMEADKAKEMAEETGAELKKIKMELAASFAAANNTGLELTAQHDRLYISFPNDILYGSGSASMTREGRRVLDSLATIFKNNPDLQIVVEGHTDADPINKSADKYTDNWDLSMQRSVKVTRELIRRGVAGSQLTAAGRAQFAPVAEGKTYKDKMQNRRTEFMILPKTANLHQFVK